MNRILPNLKKHDPFATRYMQITETPRDTSSATFSFGPDYLMKLLQSLQQQQNEILTVGVIGYPKVGRHELIKTLCEHSYCYQADRQTYDDLNQLRRIDQNIHLFVRPGEVVLMKRELNMNDYLYKCYPHGFVIIIMMK